MSSSKLYIAMMNCGNKISEYLLLFWYLTVPNLHLHIHCCDRSEISTSHYVCVCCVVLCASLCWKLDFCVLSMVINQILRRTHYYRMTAFTTQSLRLPIIAIQEFFALGVLAFIQNLFLICQISMTCFHNFSSVVDLVKVSFALVIKGCTFFFLRSANDLWNADIGRSKWICGWIKGFNREI